MGVKKDVAIDGPRCRLYPFNRAAAGVMGVPDH